MERRQEWERVRADVAAAPAGLDVSTRLKRLGLVIVGAPHDEPAWLIVCASSRMMDDLTLYVVPVTGMNETLRADLEAVDGHRLVDARGELAARALRLALALGAASPDDADVEQATLPASLRLAEPAAWYEVWWSHRVERDLAGRSDGTALSRCITRVIIVDDRA